MRTLHNISDNELYGKKVFVRVDFNVPVKGERVMDDTRIRKALPTIEYLMKKKAKIILASHLGRPGGEFKPELSLFPVAKRLSELLGKNVQFVEDCIGVKVENKVDTLGNEEILLLENLRFHKGEKKNDPAFVEQLSKPFEVYVNDAFGTAHRAHASTYGMVSYFSIKAAGLLLELEVKVLSALLEHPEHPYILILGGAKVKDKIGIINNLLNRADVFVIGGGMSYTFLKANGQDIGSSILDKDHLPKVAEFISRFPSKFVLPVDHIVVRNLEDLSGKTETNHIEGNYMGADIGRNSIKLFKEHILKGKTIFWNGPLGVFEKDELANGTIEIAKTVKLATQKGAFSVIGGGDTVSAIHKAGLSDRDFSHVSTGGGATLEFLAGITLPGIEALSD